jgi:hypothetical protein
MTSASMCGILVLDSRVPYAQCKHCEISRHIRAYVVLQISHFYTSLIRMSERFIAISIKNNILVVLYCLSQRR